MTWKEEVARQERARELFFAAGSRTPDTFSDVVYDSWQRSLDNWLSCHVPYDKVLSPQELAERREDNRRLLEVAIPFMELLYGIVKGSGFTIMLGDSEGYILKLMGDEEILEYSRKRSSPLVEGSCRSELLYGTNGVGTSLVTREPITLTSIEHFRRELKGVTGTAAPLIMPDGSIVGSLSMSGAADKVHLHTLGMITAASRAIVEQMALRQINRQLDTTKNQLRTILDTFDHGVLLLNENNAVVDTNKVALTFLGLEKPELLGRPIDQLIPPASFDFSAVQSDALDVEASIRCKYTSAPVFITVRVVNSAEPAYRKALLVMFREAASVHKLVRRYIGSNAHFTFEDIMGESPVFRDARDNARIAAHNSSNVLLIGESGTGKELFAQAIHNSSRFSSGPFVAVNCGAIPKSLIESELFGYEAGAFTGANRSGNAGKFELANNGTILLDEIGDMPYDVQIHLLRILQTKEVTRLGGKKPIPLNIRVIAATNVDLAQAIQEKIFRSDLYYRLNVLTFRIPPLRERGADVLLLTDYFIQKYQQPNRPLIKGVTDAVKTIFLDYSWPETSANSRTPSSGPASSPKGNGSPPSSCRSPS